MALTITQGRHQRAESVLIDAPSTIPSSTRSSRAARAPCRGRMGRCALRLVPRPRRLATVSLVVPFARGFPELAPEIAWASGERRHRADGHWSSGGGLRQRRTGASRRRQPRRAACRRSHRGLDAAAWRKAPAAPDRRLAHGARPSSPSIRSGELRGGPARRRPSRAPAPEKAPTGSGTRSREREADGPRDCTAAVPARRLPRERGVGRPVRAGLTALGVAPICARSRVVRGAPRSRRRARRRPSARDPARPALHHVQARVRWLLPARQRQRRACGQRSRRPPPTGRVRGPALLRSSRSHRLPCPRDRGRGHARALGRAGRTTRRVGRGASGGDTREARPAPPDDVGYE
jgi:hypothetical protein